MGASADPPAGRLGVMEPAPQSTEIKFDEQCDACGLPVAPEDAFRGELAVGDMMCPAPMLFHKACYEKASELWKPDPDSYCTVDSEYPETAQWSQEVPPQTTP